MLKIVAKRRSGQGERLAERWKCSGTMVSRSLCFALDSMLARRIRHDALNSGDYVCIESEE